jgi:hypothetical protein
MSTLRFLWAAAAASVFLTWPTIALAGGAGEGYAHLVGQSIKHGRAACWYEQSGIRTEYRLPAGQSCPKEIDPIVVRSGWTIGIEWHLVHASEFRGTTMCAYRNDGKTRSITLPIIGEICPAFHRFFVSQ